MYKCYLCNYIGKMKIKTKVDNKNILLCPKCKLEFMFPQTTDHELNIIYNNKNYPTCNFDDGYNTNSIVEMKKKHSILC